MRLALAWMLLTSMVGCTSIRTNMWTRGDDDTLHPDPCQNLKGLPVMLKVPSHIEVKIIETLYAAHDPGSHQLEVVKLNRPDLRVDAQLKYTEKMFLVDPVRVGAGSGAYGFGFAPAAGNDPIKSGDPSNPTSGHGYLHSAMYKADDQTIKESGLLLESIMKFGTRSGTTSTSATTAARLNLTTIDRVVAFRRFDLASDCADQEVFAFLESHLNQCHKCSLNNTQTIPIEVPESPAAGKEGGGSQFAIPIQIIEAPKPK